MKDLSACWRLIEIGACFWGGYGKIWTHGSQTFIRRISMYENVLASLLNSIFLGYIPRCSDPADTEWNLESAFDKQPR